MISLNQAKNYAGKTMLRHAQDKKHWTKQDHEDDVNQMSRLRWFTGVVLSVNIPYEQSEFLTYVSFAIRSAQDVGSSYHQRYVDGLAGKIKL